MITSVLCQISAVLMPNHTQTIPKKQCSPFEIGLLILFTLKKLPAEAPFGKNSSILIGIFMVKEKEMDFPGRI